MSRVVKDRKLTLREAFEKHYDKSQLARGSLKLMRYMLGHWERATGDPPIGDVTNQTAERFRDWCLSRRDGEKLAPSTINHYWGTVRAIFRRLGPQVTGNPGGLGIIDRFPYLRPLRHILPLPRRLSLDDLDRFYLACSIAKYPRRIGVVPADAWRALIVVAYTTALRRSDLFSIRLADIDLEEGRLRFVAQKTLKAGTWPLHPAAIEHIRRAWAEREFLFERFGHNCGNFSENWNAIMDKAAIAEPFTLHDIRRTAVSEIDRVVPGMGAVFAQHRPTDVTGTSYLNKLPELEETLPKMRMPLTFAHGVKQAERAETRARERREKMMATSEFRPPKKPDPSEWRFPEGQANLKTLQFSFRGQCFFIGAAQWRLLQALATSPAPCGLDELADAIYERRKRPELRERIGQRVASAISILRRSLIREFDLHPRFDPAPCLERGHGGLWTLLLPAEAVEGNRRAS